jgi:hypothetical protein
MQLFPLFSSFQEGRDQRLKYLMKSSTDVEKQLQIPSLCSNNSRIFFGGTDTSHIWNSIQTSVAVDCLELGSTLSEKSTCFVD